MIEFRAQKAEVDISKSILIPLLILCYKTLRSTQKFHNRSVSLACRRPSVKIYPHHA